jgi:DNA-binding cell septation regulator SpoVG|tara:strand:- start:898 stop:1239 length:342 start_codon:yes stop_codon:yes gene_type:complete
MTIERMKKGNWGNIVAFFDLKTEDGFLITGMKIVDGVNGKFIGFPSKKNEQEGKYSEIVRAEKETREKAEKLALEHYNRETEDTFNAIPGAYDEDKTTEEVEKIDKTTEELPF